MSCNIVVVHKFPIGNGEHEFTEIKVNINTKKDSKLDSFKYMGIIINN